MKKLIMLMLCLFFIVNLSISAEASDFTTSLNGKSSIDTGETFAVDIGVSSSVDVKEIKGNLNYNNEQLELISMAGKNGFNLMGGANLTAVAESPKNGTFIIGTLTFRARESLAPGDRSEIALSSTQASDGDRNYLGTGSSHSVTVSSPPEPKSDNNFLSSLELDRASISFNKNTTTYNVTVDHDITSISIKARAEDPKATIGGLGSKPLQVYENRFDITVTAENGSQRTYTLNVLRRDQDGNTKPVAKSDNNYLSSLKLDPGKITFNKNTTTYQMAVDHSAPSISIQAEAEDAKARVDGAGNKSLQVGNNSFEIIVTAEDGSKRNYRIDVLRRNKEEEASPETKSDNNYLTSLELSQGNLSFNKNIQTYHLTVDYDISMINVGATREDPKANVQGLGNKNLEVGDNRFTITVTAEDGSLNHYILNITRKEESADPDTELNKTDLSHLYIDGNQIDLQPGVLEYRIAVEHYISTVNVSAVAADSFSSVEIEKPEVLEYGSNIIVIYVTDENGETREYRVEVVRREAVDYLTIEELEGSLDRITDDRIFVRQNEDGIINDRILMGLKEHGKTLILHGMNEEGKILYEWIIEGNLLEEFQTLYTLISFDSENKEQILSLGNVSGGMILSFDRNEKLFNGTSIRINVSGIYAEGERLYLYYFNSEEEKLEARGEYIVDEEGFVRISPEHTSEFLLTNSLLEEEEVPGFVSVGHESLPVQRDSSLIIYLGGLQLVAIIGIGAYYLTIRKKRAKQY